MADRQMIGRRNRAAGKAAEDQLALYHHWCEVHGYAFVRHNGTMAEKRGGTWCPVPSLVDYEGFLTQYNAHHIAFDLKHVTEPVYHHPKDKLHQTDYLWRVDQNGGTAFLLLVVEVPGEDPAAYAFWPEEHWQKFYDKGFTLKLYPGRYVPPWSGAVGQYIPDWLEIAIPRMLKKQGQK